MAKNTFTMHCQKQGRLKYVLLTLLPPLGLMYLFQYLLERRVLPANSITGVLCVALPLVAILFLSHYLIFRKNHTIHVENNTITEVNWRGQEFCRVKASQIQAVRRNFLGEIILLDINGSRLLCIESNMSNLDRLQQWLAEHTR